ncbi:hypothetical protein L249_4568 [Ophiocordyceps polyrhachis-furcata BCC 54312]|uniref:HypA-like protein n=1 Tax=Ophiocordyceps polyrhachis-furcata BCC 54312 TaxID=1330021 RepID=A0A367KZ77_9HYPO|nr:hypothetical protein L249_4568 [Ophiocordyceps polyrhachis-furcata BCC 54312]
MRLARSIRTRPLQASTPRLFSSVAMATPYRFSVSPTDTGLLKVKQDDDAAARVSELLQDDLETHHVFFNDDGFHNHIAHQLLTLYGTGSSAEDLTKAYDLNKAYQLPARKGDVSIADSLSRDWEKEAPKFLGKGDHYADFLLYFQREIEKQTWQAVVEKHVFGDSPSCLDLLGRLCAGFYHPLIQLMYGIEWEQPALVAEGLAQAAVHDGRITELMREVDEYLASTAAEEVKLIDSLPDLLESLRDKYPKLAASAHWEDPNRIYDGVLKRARPEAVALLAGIRVRDRDLEERTAEMLHASAYVVAAAAWNPPYVPKFDFFLLHNLTSAPFFLTLNKLPTIPTSSKARLLTWKMRMDVIGYLSRGLPPLRMEDTLAIPDDATQARDLVSRFRNIVDDGHLIKVVRSLLLAEEASAPYGARAWIRLRHGRDWLRALNRLLVGSEGARLDQIWVRSAGFPEAWRDLPKL